MNRMLELVWGVLQLLLLLLRLLVLLHLLLLLLQQIVQLQQGASTSSLLCCCFGVYTQHCPKLLSHYKGVLFNAAAAEQQRQQR